MKSEFFTDELIKLDPFVTKDSKKSALLLKAVIEELQFHYENNDLYRRFCENKSFDPFKFSGRLDELPAVSVSVFKELGENLKSITDDQVKLSLKSSATSGVPSTVVLDKLTAKRQAKVMIKVLKDYLGSERRPFIVIDVKPEPKNLNFLGARYAAIGGYLNFAGKVHYSLEIKNDLAFFNSESTSSFISDLEQKEPVVVFGFTYMLYSQVVKPLLDSGANFTLPPNSKVIHIGGWKKLENEKISKEEFNNSMSSLFGIRPEDVIDIYGFTEQMGLNYPDCQCGFKHAPIYSEVIVRDPATRQIVAKNEPGILEFISPIPHSYPGNVILTDDLGMINSEPCPYGRNGTRFKIIGRLKKAEVRGCGDILGDKLKFKLTPTDGNKDASKLEVHFWKGGENPHNQSVDDQLKEIIRDLNTKKEWLRAQPIDALIGLIGEASKRWSNADGDLQRLKEKGLSFLANWSKPEHLNRLATLGLRGNRQHIDSFLPHGSSRKQYLKANQRGLACHWMAGNVQVLGMFALLQSILTKNVNLLKISSKDEGVFAGLLSAFENLTYTTGGGYTIHGNDLLKTIAIVYFSHKDIELGEIMSKAANIRIAWGGREAVESVTGYPSNFDTEDLIFGPKLSFSVVARESLSTERSARKLARKVAVDASVFDQTGCASPHNLFIEKNGEISPQEFCALLAEGMKKSALQIPKGEETVEQISAIHSIRGLYDFKGNVWSSDDSTWTVVYSDDMNLSSPVYSRVIMVHPVDHINETLKFIDDNIQTVGLSAVGQKAINFAELAVEKGVMRCPEIGRMLNFESPWDGIFLMDRMVRWSTLGGPLV